MTPGATSKLNPSRAVTPPYRLTRPRTETSSGVTDLCMAPLALPGASLGFGLDGLHAGRRRRTEHGLRPGLIKFSRRLGIGGELLQFIERHAGQSWTHIHAVRRHHLRPCIVETDRRRLLAADRVDEQNDRQIPLHERALAERNISVSVLDRGEIFGGEVVAAGDELVAIGGVQLAQTGDIRRAKSDHRHRIRIGGVELLPMIVIVDCADLSDSSTPFARFSSTGKPGKQLPMTTLPLADAPPSLSTIIFPRMRPLCVDLSPT